MGRLDNSGDDPKRLLRHSSHDHHLELTSASVLPSDRATCFGCDFVILPGKPPHLSCKACGFHLHRDCYDFPERIRHPADDHVLVLDTSKVAPFRCKACDSDGRGFAYRCATCRRDFHCACAAKPLSVTDLSVHEHELRLCFKPPYDGENGFRCDLCRCEGYSWLYCCQGCHFDVHIDYAKCKVARISGMTRSIGDSDSVQGNFPVMMDQVPGYLNATNTTTTRALINNSGLPPAGNFSQVGPNGSFGYFGGQGVGAPNPGQAYGNNNFVYLQPPQGNNQPMYLRPNGVAPMNVVQPNTGFGYGTPMMANGYRQGGMKDMFVGGIASGLGEGFGQGFVGMGMDALGMGGGSSTGLDLGSGASDFADCYAGDWASSIF